MASTLIPFSSTRSSQTKTVQIDGRTYRIRAAWEDRNASWYLSIGTLSAWLVEGERATVNQPVLRRTHADMPSGMFSLLDSDGQGEAGEDDLGERVFVLYKQDDLPEARSFEEEVTVTEVV